MGKLNKSAIVTMVERSSRVLMAFTIPSGHRSDGLRARIIEAFRPLPASLRRTLTWDRGAEMAKHAEVTAAIGTDVYFCDPASPWQRGSNANANGLLCQYFRRGTDLNALDEAEINDRPRAVLGWASPATRFTALQAVAALQGTAVSAATGSLPGQGHASAAHNWGQSQWVIHRYGGKGATPMAPHSSRG